MMTPRVLAFFDSDYRSRPGGPSADAAWRRVLDAPIVSRHHFPLSRPSTLGTYDLADVGQARRVTALARQTGIDGFVLDIVWTGDDYDCGAAVLGAACDDDVLLAFRWRNETEPLWFDPSKGEARLSRLLALIAALKTAVAGRPAATPLILIVNTPKVDDIPGLVGTLRTAAVRAGLPPVHLIANRAEDKGRFIAAGYDALLDPAPDEWHACPPQNRPTGLDTLDVMAGLKDCRSSHSTGSFPTRCSPSHGC